VGVRIPEGLPPLVMALKRFLQIGFVLYAPSPPCAAPLLGCRPSRANGPS